MMIKERENMSINPDCWDVDFVLPNFIANAFVFIARTKLMKKVNLNLTKEKRS